MNPITNTQAHNATTTTTGATHPTQAAHTGKPTKGIRDSGYEDFDQHGLGATGTTNKTVPGSFPADKPVAAHEQAKTEESGFKRLIDKLNPLHRSPSPTRHDATTTAATTATTGASAGRAGLGTSGVVDRNRSRSSSASPTRVAGLSAKNPNFPGEDNRTKIEKIEDKLDPRRHAPQDGHHSSAKTSTATGAAAVGHHNTAATGHHTTATGHPLTGAGAGTHYDTRTVGEKTKDKLDPRVDSNDPYLRQAGSKDPYDQRTAAQKVKDKLDPRVDSQDPHNPLNPTRNHEAVYDNRTAAEKAKDKVDPRVDSTTGAPNAYGAPGTHGTHGTHTAAGLGATGAAATHDRHGQYDNRTAAEKAKDKLDPRVDANDPHLRQSGTNAYDNRTAGQKVKDKLDPRVDSDAYSRDRPVGQAGVADAQGVHGVHNTTHGTHDAYNTHNTHGVSNTTHNTHHGTTAAGLGAGAAGLGAAGAAATHDRHGQYDNRTAAEKAKDKLDPRVDANDPHLRQSGTNAYDDRTAGQKIKDKLDPRVDSDAYSRDRPVGHTGVAGAQGVHGVHNTHGTHDAYNTHNTHGVSNTHNTHHGAATAAGLGAGAAGLGAAAHHDRHGQYDNRTATEKAKDKFDPRVDSNDPYLRQTGSNAYDNRTAGQKVKDKLDPRVDSDTPPHDRSLGHNAPHTGVAGTTGYGTTAHGTTGHGTYTDPATHHNNHGATAAGLGAGALGAGAVASHGLGHHDNRTAGEKTKDKLDPRIESNDPYVRQSGSAAYDNRTATEKVKDKLDPRVDSDAPYNRQTGTAGTHGAHHTASGVKDNRHPTFAGVHDTQHTNSAGQYDNRKFTEKVKDKLDPRRDSPSPNRHRGAAMAGAAGVAGAGLAASHKHHAQDGRTINRETPVVANNSHEPYHVAGTNAPHSGTANIENSLRQTHLDDQPAKPSATTRIKEAITSILPGHTSSTTSSTEPAPRAVHSDTRPDAYKMNEGVPVSHATTATTGAQHHPTSHGIGGVGATSHVPERGHVAGQHHHQQQHAPIGVTSGMPAAAHHGNNNSADQVYDRFTDTTSTGPRSDVTGHNIPTSGVPHSSTHGNTANLNPHHDSSVPEIQDSNNFKPGYSIPPAERENVNHGAGQNISSPGLGHAATGAAPSGLESDVVRTTGFRADGGNFDAANPGAGTEANRLKARAEHLGTSLDRNVAGHTHSQTGTATGGTGTGATGAYNQF